MPVYERSAGVFRVVVWANGRSHERVIRGASCFAEEAERRMRDDLGLPPPRQIEETDAMVGASEVIWIRGGVGSYVYFIQAGNGGAIKIGWTKHAKVRLRYMQTGNPARLKLLCAVPGGRYLEATLHRAFKEHRIEGEWYNPCPLLLKLVEELSLANHRAPNHGAHHGAGTKSSILSSMRH